MRQPRDHLYMCRGGYLLLIGFITAFYRTWLPVLIFEYHCCFHIKWIVFAIQDHIWFTRQAGYRTGDILKAKASWASSCATRMAQLSELVQGSYRPPAAVTETFRSQAQQAGFNSAGNFCWTVVKSALKLWRYREGPLAQISSRQLPESTRSACFVEISEPAVRLLKFRSQPPPCASRSRTAVCSACWAFISRPENCKSCAWFLTS